MDKSTFSRLACLQACAKPLKAWYESYVIHFCSSTMRPSLKCHEASTSACKPSKEDCFCASFQLRSQLVGCFDVPPTHQVFDQPITERVVLEPPLGRLGACSKGNVLVEPSPPRCSVQQDEQEVFGVSHSILSGEDTGNNIQISASSVLAQQSNEGWCKRSCSEGPRKC